MTEETDYLQHSKDELLVQISTWSDRYDPQYAFLHTTIIIITYNRVDKLEEAEFDFKEEIESINAVVVSKDHEIEV